MASELDNLKAVANRLRIKAMEKEAEARKYLEAYQNAMKIVRFSEEGDIAIEDESKKEEQETVEEGPSGKELVLEAIRDYRASNPDKHFKGADLSAIIRKKGSWKKKTPLANMIFMNLKRLVASGELEEVEGAYREKPLVTESLGA